MRWLRSAWAALAATGLVFCAQPLALGAALSQATPDVIERLADGELNWTRHSWRVCGHSLPVSPALSFGGPIRQAGGALALAQADAHQHLVELSKAIFWGTQSADETSPASMLAASAETPWGEARVVATQFFADGHVRLTQDVHWDPALAEALWRARQTSLGRQKAAHKPPAQGALPSQGMGTMPTGLVVNALGLYVRPALLPELRDETGATLFDIGDVHPRALSRFGVARFSHSLAAAVKEERMGAHPAVVRAHAVAQDAPWVVMVDARQAAIVQAAAAPLAQARIIIVIDEGSQASSIKN